MAGSRSTLKDVAEAAGVSIATASIVLRRLPNALIGDETRRRVQEAARRLRYRHNALAASLRKGTSDLVAFVVDSLSRPTLGAKVAAAEDVLEQNGLRTVFWHTSKLAKMEENALKDIRSQMVSGLLVGYQVGSRGVPLLRQFGEDGLPMVMLEPTDDVVSDVVTVDREAVTYLGTHHLLSLGHRRVGIAGDEPFLDTVRRWGCGYARALGEFGVEAEQDLIFHLSSDATFEAGYEVGQRVAAMAAPPTGLMCSDDEVAIGVMRACREEGVQVPDDLAIVGFDDLPVAAFAEVPLTTIRHPTEEVGHLAAELLLRDIRAGAPSRPQTVVLQPELIVRDSCGVRRGQ
jgi:DNA-binding LacI/PurR family transcriptional regulator